MEISDRLDARWHRFIYAMRTAMICARSLRPCWSIPTITIANELFLLLARHGKKRGGLDMEQARRVANIWARRNSDE